MPPLTPEIKAAAAGATISKQSSSSSFDINFQLSTCCQNGLSVLLIPERLEEFSPFSLWSLVSQLSADTVWLPENCVSSLMRSAQQNRKKKAHTVLFVMQLLSVNFTVKNVWQKIKKTLLCVSVNCESFWLFVPCFPPCELKMSPSNKQHSTVTWSIHNLMPLTSLLQELQEFASSTLSNTQTSGNTTMAQKLIVLFYQIFVFYGQPIWDSMIQISTCKAQAFWHILNFYSGYTEGCSQVKSVLYIKPKITNLPQRSVATVEDTEITSSIKKIMHGDSNIF